MLQPRNICVLLLVAALFSIPTLTASTITTPKTSPPHHESKISASSDTTLLSLPTTARKRFHAIIRLGEITLPYISLLMLGVNSLATLALKDPKAYSPGAYYRLAEYPAVIVAIDPRDRSKGVTYDVALQCVFFGMDYLISNQLSKNASVDCFWDTTLVAQVLFDRPTTGAHPIIAAASKANAGTLDRLDRSSAIDTDPTNISFSTGIANVKNISFSSLSTHFSYPDEAHSMTMEDVFMTALTVLKALAPYPATDYLKYFKNIETEPRWDTTMRFSAEAYRIKPPFCDYGWLIESTRRMPAFMLEHGRWAEVVLVVFVDRVFVCDALLEKGR